MTTRRLVASLTASAAALALAATFAVRSFPLEAQGRMQPGTGDPVQLVMVARTSSMASCPSIRTAPSNTRSRATSWSR